MAYPATRGIFLIYKDSSKACISDLIFTDCVKESSPQALGNLLALKKVTMILI